MTFEKPIPAAVGSAEGPYSTGLPEQSLQRDCPPEPDWVIVARMGERTVPGAAGADWDAWQPTPFETYDQLGVYRFGDLQLPDGTIGAPAILPLLDRAHIACRGEGAPGIMQAVLLRALGTTPPGMVEIVNYDPHGLGETLRSFNPLLEAKLLRNVRTRAELSATLNALVDDITRINETHLAKNGGYNTLREYTTDTDTNPEPWRILALSTTGEELTEEQRGAMQQIVRNGPACGVHIITNGLELTDDPRNPQVVHVQTTVNTAAADNLSGITATIDPPPRQLINKTCRNITQEVRDGSNLSITFAELMTACGPEWTASSAEGISVPVGIHKDGTLVWLELGESPVHALVGGPTGSGKSNIIQAALCGLCRRYSPSELELYLLDFKEGATFAPYAPRGGDPSFFPHVRAVGKNVTNDREYGVDLLHRLQNTMSERSRILGEHGGLSAFREANPNVPMPRIVMVIDEFQVLLEGGDRLASAAVDLIEDLARRGRGARIHLVLASQEISGIQALWGRSALVNQFALRVALPGANRILAENNTAASLTSLPKWHAAINPNTGATPYNRIAKIPEVPLASLAEQRLQLYNRRPADTAIPEVFDGLRVPSLADNPVYNALQPSAQPPHALLAETSNSSRPAMVTVERKPGHNLAVLGTLDDGHPILYAAAHSLYRQHEPGSARFSVLCADPLSEDAAAQLAQELGSSATFYGTPEQHAELIKELHDTLSTTNGSTAQYVIGYGMGMLAPELIKLLPPILQKGPAQHHIHTLGWWSDIAHMRAAQGGITNGNSIQSWVALGDIAEKDAGALIAASAVTRTQWGPRPGRALFYSSAQNSKPQVIIPFGEGRITPITH